MIKYSFKKLFFTLFLTTLLAGTAFSADKKETTEEEDALNEFKETKFLQLDKLDVPKELTRIEEQIRQNALDVIISSKTHTPIYAQKREEGYSESYKKFHGLEIQIVPIPGDQDFYSLNFFYYNWTNRKFDKHLRKRISKFNVLNELRFGLYELLLGKKFVDEHKDEIEKQNYDRIQAVRENELAQARIDRKKKKLEKKLKEEKELKLSREEEDKKKSKLTRGEKDKKDKNSINPTEQSNQTSAAVSVAPTEDFEDVKVEDPDEPEKLKEKPEVEKKRKAPKKPALPKMTKEEPAPATPPIPEIPKPEVGETIPTTSSLYAFVNIFNDSVTADGYLHTTTHLRYLGFGARYIQEQETAMPRGMRFSLKVGLPIKKDNYSFPIYRAFETEIYKRKILNHFQLFAGIDLSPIYFVNLANPGEGLKVFENDIFWLKGGIGFNQEIFGKEIELRTLFLKSLSGKSNQKKSIGGTSLAFTGYYQHTKKHGVEITYQKSNMVGDLLVASQSLYFSYVYKFEN